MQTMQVFRRCERPSVVTAPTRSTRSTCPSVSRRVEKRSVGNRGIDEVIDARVRVSGDMRTLDAFIRFSRPHTVIGTAVGIKSSTF